MDAGLLDSDTLSEVLKRKDQHVLAKAGQYLAQYRRLPFSAITAYEIIRGLRAKRATRQLAAFLRLLSTSEVFGISFPILMRAADLWADAQSGGCPRDDADLIIAATALEHGRVLITGNTGHFSWINGLRLVDWRQP
jgi:tRNA(fMet)-specific endonuclease VapC